MPNWRVVVIVVAAVLAIVSAATGTWLSVIGMLLLIVAVLRGEGPRRSSDPPSRTGRGDGRAGAPPKDTIG